MILNAAMAIILRYFTEFGIAEVTTNECITEGHLRDIDSLYCENTSPSTVCRFVVTRQMAPLCYLKFVVTMRR